MRLSRTSRNDPDDFFTLFLIERHARPIESNRRYGANRYPSLLIFKSEVALRKSVRIIEWRFQSEHRVCEGFAGSSVHSIQIASLVATRTEYAFQFVVSIHLYVHTL
jgi:hypothetical protein